MGKEFKLYDKKYAHLKKGAVATPEEQEKAKSVTCWPAKVQQWAQEDVQRAVYTCTTAEEWQQFRVKLKAVNTKIKLLRLANYVIEAARHTDVERVMRIIRVDNYIGALLRGGQLSSDGKHTVLK